MTLRELLGNGAPELEISGLAYSSQSVTPGTLFFCVPGFRSDGHDFAPDAVERGAAALVCQRSLHLGVPEVVVDGETGLLVEAGDFAGLATAVEGLLTDPERAVALGEAGRRRAVAEFSVARMAERTHAVRLIERRPMPPLGHFSLIRFAKAPAGVERANRFEARAGG